jgi:hypothetical protein
MTHQVIAFTRSMRLSVNSTEVPPTAKRGNENMPAEPTVALTVALRYLAERKKSPWRLLPGLALQYEGS